MSKLFIRIINKLKRILCSLNKIFYGNFGYNSYIVLPSYITQRKNISIGNNVFIRNNARIEPVTQWYNNSYKPKVIIEDNVSIEQNIQLTCSNFVKIGKNTMVNSYVFITDIDHDYSEINEPIKKQKLIVSETIIGEDCFIGTGVKIMAGVKLGNHCVVGANAVVTHSFPDYCVIAGVPAKVIKKYDFEKSEWVKITKLLYSGGGE